jgi:hypothetical protein
MLMEERVAKRLGVKRQARAAAEQAEVGAPFLDGLPL